jgi:hypothetical protein
MYMPSPPPVIAIKSFAIESGKSCFWHHQKKPHKPVAMLRVWGLGRFAMHLDLVSSCHYRQRIIAMEPLAYAQKRMPLSAPRVIGREAWIGTRTQSRRLLLSWRALVVLG